MIRVYTVNSKNGRAGSGICINLSCAVEIYGFVTKSSNFSWFKFRIWNMTKVRHLEKVGVPEMVSPPSYTISV